MPSAALAELERRELRRARRTAQTLSDGRDPAVVRVDGRQLVNFCSNDYLGLAAHPEVIEALRSSAARLGVGSGASHLVTGHGFEHERLEEELAAFTGRERTVLVSTGYMANLAAIGSCVGPGDLVVLDRLSHASLIDAALLSRARVCRHAHADASAAAGVLAARLREGAAFIATDGVFSMDGDVAPVRELAELARRHDAWLLVDDAHGLGVIGATGRGSLEHSGVREGEVPLLVGTLGKAFGTFGAFIAGEADLVEYLIQTARPYIYTTALPQCLAAATRTALALVEREAWRRERLHALVARFRAGAAALGLPLSGSMTPIQPIQLGTAGAAVSASRALEERGFWVTAIRPPTVPAGSARLRVTLSAAHSEAQVDALVDALSSVLRGACAGAA